MDNPNPIPYSFFIMSDNQQIVMSLMLLFVFFILKKNVFEFLKMSLNFSLVYKVSSIFLGISMAFEILLLRQPQIN